MKTQSTKQMGCTARHIQRLAVCAALILLLPLAAWAGGTVTNCTEADFLAAAAGGGTVTFACDGTITLSQTFTNNLDTVLDGTGHQVRISGSNAVRLFWVATNVSFTVVNLTLSDGFAGNGAAILNLGGNVQLTGVGLTNNTATTQATNSMAWWGLGGAVLNAGGRLAATNCLFVNNRAYSATGAFTGGGAIGNENGGQVNLERCAFTGNSALGADSTGLYAPMGNLAVGGAINNRGALVVHACTLSANSATGGRGYSAGGGGGGWGFGGAIFNDGDCAVYASTCSSNVASGGSGGAGSWPVGGYGPGPNGGLGGPGLGGALYDSGTASLVNCTLAGNRGSGGNGGRGGTGGSSFPHASYGYPGGDGGDGGNGIGGVYGASMITNCTLAFNIGTAGTGGGGGPGGFGYISSGPPGTNGLSGTAWGATTYATLPNTLIAFNTPAGNDTFVDPRLGPLADNGGPTLTMALLPGSPAIDAGNTAIAPVVDQRGFLRPAGAAADIGAFEFGAEPPPPTILPPSITKPPFTQTAEMGATVCFSVRVTNTTPASTHYQWCFSGTIALGGATNSHVYLTNVQPAQAGSYTVVVTNLAGAVTSPPAMLSVIPSVPRRTLPALTLTGQLGSFLSLDYRSTPDSSASWNTFDTVLLTNVSQWYFDLTPSPALQRFYRAWQPNVLSPPSVQDVHLVPAITLTGAIGSAVRVDYINQFGPVDVWVTNLATVTLTNTSQLYFDTSIIGQPARLYRIVPLH